MTLLSAYRATKVLWLAVVLAAGGMTAADAGGRRHHHHQHDHSARLRYVPHLDNAFGGRAGSVLRYGGNHDRQARDRNFYDRAFADAIVPWFSALAARGATVLVGDPGRAYCPRERMEALATYQVSVTRALEDSEVKKTTVWRFTSAAG